MRPGIFGMYDITPLTIYEERWRYMRHVPNMRIRRIYTHPLTWQESKRSLAVITSLLIDRQITSRTPNISGIDYPRCTIQTKMH